MNYRLLACAAVTAMLATAPALAQSSSMSKMDCTAADMKKVNTEMMKMSAGKKKQMAMKEMEMAESRMKKKT